MQPQIPRKQQSKKKKGTLSIILDVLIVLLVAAATLAMFKLTAVKPENQEDNIIARETDEEEEDEEDKYAEIDLNPVIRTWYDTRGGATAGIEIYDLDNEKIVGTLNEHDAFGTASEYKLFVVYDGYRRVERGEWGENDASYGGKTVGECLDLTIRESNSGCAENLWERIGRDNLENIIRTDYGLAGSSATNLTSTASDMVEMMKIYYEHKELSDGTWKKIQDSMLNQPPSMGLCGDEKCDWRQGLPSGFIENTKVYDKVGWNYNGAFWDVYDDVAILEFPDYDRHFAIAVMTSGFASPDKLAELGGMLEEAILAYIELE